MGTGRQVTSKVATELRGKPGPGRPLLVLAVKKEAQFLDTGRPVLLTGMGKVIAAARPSPAYLAVVRCAPGRW